MLFGKWFAVDRKDEDSLENTLSCVPKVQGAGSCAESLRQKDRDALPKVLCAFLSSPLNGLLFL